MSFSATERNDILSAWIQPSSESEQDRQDRAVRMIRSAIDEHPAFEGVDIAIYAKGSYANNTNVRLDSDVDIVVQCDEVFYYDCAPGAHPATSLMTPYSGIWTPALWRGEVVAALNAYFGSSEIDASGRIAIAIKETIGSRPNVDVVPSFKYRKYWTLNPEEASEGSVVYATDSARIVNWPQQQLANGRQKNVRTGQRYKRFVRALKNAENVLRDARRISAKPSYLMECLVYNVADTTLQNGGTLVTDFQSSLFELWSGLESNDHVRWLEPNDLKYVFGDDQKWTAQDARAVVLATWNYLYG
jgi:hypothetical protein